MGLGFGDRVRNLGSQGLGFRLWTSGFRVWGSGFGLCGQGLGPSIEDAWEPQPYKPDEPAKGSRDYEFMYVHITHTWSFYIAICIYSFAHLYTYRDRAVPLGLPVWATLVFCHMLPRPRSVFHCFNIASAFCLSFSPF